MNTEAGSSTNRTGIEYSMAGYSLLPLILTPFVAGAVLPSVTVTITSAVVTTVQLAPPFIATSWVYITTTVDEAHTLTLSQGTLYETTLLNTITYNTTFTTLSEPPSRLTSYSTPTSTDSQSPLSTLAPKSSSAVTTSLNSTTTPPISQASPQFLPLSGIISLSVIPSVLFFALIALLIYYRRQRRAYAEAKLLASQPSKDSSRSHEPVSLSRRSTARSNPHYHSQSQPRSEPHPHPPNFELNHKGSQVMTWPGLQHGFVHPGTQVDLELKPIDDTERGLPSWESKRRDLEPVDALGIHYPDSNHDPNHQYLHRHAEEEDFRPDRPDSVLSFMDGTPGVDYQHHGITELQHHHEQQPGGGRQRLPSLFAPAPLRLAGHTPSPVGSNTVSPSIRATRFQALEQLEGKAPVEMECYTPSIYSRDENEERTEEMSEEERIRRAWLRILRGEARRI